MQLDFPVTYHIKPGHVCAARVNGWWLVIRGHSSGRTKHRLDCTVCHQCLHEDIVSMQTAKCEWSQAVYNTEMYNIFMSHLG